MEMVYRKIFATISVVLETFFSIVIWIVGLVTFVACIENICIQNRVKAFMAQGEYEETIDNTIIYAVKSDFPVEETIKISETSIDLGMAGDMFIMPQSRIDVALFSDNFITYLFGGHAGVNALDDYGNPILIEAMGGGAEEAYVLDTGYPDLYSEDRSVIGLRVKASYLEREKAWKYAKTLVGKPYNYAFLFNTANSYYCTDLCSRIYGREASLPYQLDWNGFATSTQDLFLSKDTYISYFKYVSNGKTYIYYLK